MKRIASAVWSGIGALAVATVLAACGSGAGVAGYGGSSGQGGTAAQAPAAPARGPLVSARKVAGVGTVLTDRSGRTVYSPVQEANGTIACTGSCLGFWFPVSVAPGTPLRPVAGVGGALGTIRRADDGLRQLTYNGRPLYTFRLDQAAGQARGNNVMDRFGSLSFTWHVVTASGQPAGTAPSASPGTYSYPGGGSSGYGA